MKSPSALLFLAAACALGALAPGCLKPNTVATRQFVLTPVAMPEGAPQGHPAVGVGLVKMPSYLLSTSIPVRKSANEIAYSETALWAERLDHGFQRVLAANLSRLLPTDQIRLSAWRREDVAAAVYVNVEQLDVDAQGHAVLVAWWRVSVPEEDKILRSGEARLAKPGPSPETDPHGAVATLSSLVAEFSQTLIQPIRETIATAKPNR